MNNEEKILELLGQLTSDMAGVKSDISGLNNRMGRMETNMAGLNDRMSRMEADMADMKTQLNELDDRIIQVAAIQENEVLKKINVALEGISVMRETLAPKSRLEKLEETIRDDYPIVREAVASHADQIAKLKKAQ